MKKIISSFLLFIFIFSFIENVNAYSTSNYTINIPSSYKKAVDGSFTNENGDNINIQIVEFSGDSTNAFTEEGLNSAVENMSSNVDILKDELKKSIKDRYGEQFTDSEINEYVKSVKFNAVDKKEITTATKNKYKCYHIIASYSIGGADILILNNYFIYTLFYSVRIFFYSEKKLI